MSLDLELLLDELEELLAVLLVQLVGDVVQARLLRQGQGESGGIIS